MSATPRDNADPPQTPGGLETTRPRPLLYPVLAFIAGITISEAIGLTSPAVRNTSVWLAILIVTFSTLGNRVAAFLGKVLGSNVLSRRLCRFGGGSHEGNATPDTNKMNSGGRDARPTQVNMRASQRDARPTLLNMSAGAFVILAAGLLGFARHQAELNLPANHVVHYLAQEPVLTRLGGRILTPPLAAPAEKRNPFLTIEPSPRVRFVFEARELLTTDPPTLLCGLVRVSVEAERIEASAGDYVILTGELYRPIGPRNPGDVDWARWNRDQRIYACMSLENAVHVRRIGTEGLSVPAAISSWLRGRAQRLLLESFAPDDDDRSQRLLDALVLGQRSSAGRELNEVFLRCGALHFLAVSGFHVGVLMGFVWWIAVWLCRVSLRKTAAIMLAMLILYALLVEPNAPILRAATMGILLCLALLMRRPFCGWNWLALSGLCILCYNPFELFRAGFQLSFVQVIAIYTIVPRVYAFVTRRKPAVDLADAPEDVVDTNPLRRLVCGGIKLFKICRTPDSDSWSAFWFRTVYCWIAGLIVVCVIAWLIALPLTCRHFGRVAPWGTLQSILISPLVMATIVLGFLALLTQAIPGVAFVTATLLHGATSLLLKVADVLSGWSGAVIEPPAPPAWLIFASYALLAAGYAFSRRTRAEKTTEPPPFDPPLFNRKRVTALTAGLLYTGVWLLWILMPPTPRHDDPTLCVLAVGNGLSTLLVTPDGHALAYDVGSIHNTDAGETARRAARVLGARCFDTLALSHDNFDHYSGLPTLLAEWPPAEILTNPYHRAPLLDHPPIRAALASLPATPEIRNVKAGDEFNFASSAENPACAICVEILWPAADLPDSWRANDCSLLCRVTINGCRVLLTGDVERPALRELTNRHRDGRLDLRADVLIAPHHGAVIPNDTEDFYRVVAPRIVINSAAQRRPKLDELLQEVFGDQVQLYTTGETGAVLVNFQKDDTIAVDTPFAAQSTEQH